MMSLCVNVGGLSMPWFTLSSYKTVDLNYSMFAIMLLVL